MKMANECRFLYCKNAVLNEGDACKECFESMPASDTVAMDDPTMTPEQRAEADELASVIQAALFKHLSEQKRDPDPMLVKDELYAVLSQFCKVVSVDIEPDGFKATAVVEIPGDLARHLALLPKPSIPVKFLTEL